ncbi:MAG: hypothetical protein WC718_05470 [Phycisphaerales bacterium]
MLAALAGLALAAGTASAQVFSSSPSLPINDLSTQFDTITVSGGPSSITDLNVIVQITHTWDSDVDMVLQGPTGYLLLSSDNGGAGDNYLTTRFDDAAPTSITSGAAPFNGNYRPETSYNGWSGTAGIFTGSQFTSLAGFNGGNSNGAWSLYVADGVGGDVGTLLYWSMEFNFAADPNDPNPPPPPPTVPSGNGSYTVASVPQGGMTAFRVAVMSAINPNSTGLSVRVDASPLGLSSNLALLDDGVNDDGIAGNNIFGLPVTINAAPGDYVLGFTVSDAQNRSSTGNFPNLNIQPPPPSCPEGSNAVTFSNLISNDNQGAPGNTIINLGWTSPTDFVQTIHVSGRLIQNVGGTFASEARIRVNFNDGSNVVLQPFTNATWTGPLDVFDYAFTLTNPKQASSITNVELYESFNDIAGPDATWVSLCLTYDALVGPTDPTITGVANPGTISAGDMTHFSATVNPGANPLSTGITVTADASSLGLGNVTLRDDGVNDDGIAGNNVFGANVTIPSGQTDGLFTVFLTAQDAQARQASGNFDVTILPPAPPCPDYDQPQTFTNLTSFGPIGDAGNSIKFFAFSGNAMVTELHVSGRIISGGTGTFLTEARFRVAFTDGTFANLQPFTTGTTFTIMDLFDATLPLPVPHAASEIFSIETYESFNDPGLDATWQQICVATKASQTNPVITAAAANPATGFPGSTIHFSSTVVPGANPVSTGLVSSVDLSSIGGPTLNLLDDGIHDDGIAGNGVFGNDYTIDANAPGGTFALTANANDAQGRFADPRNFNLSIAVPAQWEESVQGGGDAGESLFDPQQVTGSGSLTSVGGSISFNGADSDFFLINICDPASFFADTAAGTGGGGDLTDTQLWLFKTDGTGVEFNDDTTGVRARIDASFVVDPGNYILGISGYNRDAIDADGSLIWNNAPFGGVRAPDGPGAFNPIAGWTGTSATGAYRIDLGGACFVQGNTCDPDFNQDGNVDAGDIDYLINVVAGGENTTGRDPDFNNDGNADANDVDALLNVVAGGNCP